MRFVGDASGARMPVIGLGTWEMGVRPESRSLEVAALQLGIDAGATLVDTAEMYANGGAEEIVGEALRGRRERVFLVSKVLPVNASRRGTQDAAERSLRRLRTDRIDLYLLHWPGEHPLAETLEAFEALRSSGKIRWFGVSNFDTHEMEGALALPHGNGIVTNQVYYNLLRRGIERRLLPWCAARGISVMAYSPLDQARLLKSQALDAVAARHGATPAQVALAWCIRRPGVVAIPKASRPAHVRENVEAASLVLSQTDVAQLDAAFPAPGRDLPLETL